jgi:nucleotidyltransferase substrate binding protein (TIGR01987 family)
MKLQTTPFEKALVQLRTSLDYLRSPMAKKDPKLYLQFRGASIQAFEYSFELAAKLIRRQLAQIIPDSQEVTQMTFADLIRTAADMGLINDVKRFLSYRDARNQTSHTYDEEKATDVARVIPGFYKDALYLLKQLRQRNS